MELTWQDELHIKFNHLFECGENGRILRGIEVGQGWSKHVESLLETFDWHRTHNVPKGKTENLIKIFQIKEKFGDPRVYYDYDNDHIATMLAETVGRFEGKCQLTCEKCSTLHKNGITSKNGWLYCLCSDCLSK